MGKKVWLIAFVAQIIGFAAWGQSPKQIWVDSVISQMTLTEKIGQLLIIQVNANDNSHELSDIEEAIRTYNLGGIVFTQGTPHRIRQLGRRFNEQSKVPLLLGINADEGVGVTVDSALLFPPALMMGAVRNDSLLYYVGYQIGIELKQLGLQFGFGPTIDLSRSFLSNELTSHTFGDDVNQVGSKTSLYIQGMLDAGVIPFAKWYSNYSMSVTGFKKGSAIINNRDDPQKIEVLKQVSTTNCQGILCASRQEPIFPNKRYLLRGKNQKVSKSVPATYTAQYLKENVGFKGLVISYIPDVQPALKKKYRAGDSEIYALKAGNDMLLSPKNIRTAIRKLRKAIRGDRDLQKSLNTSLGKILALKYDSRRTQDVNGNIRNELLTSELLIRDLQEQSVTIVKDDRSVLPIKTLDNQRFACISIGNEQDNPFSEYLSKYVDVDHFKLDEYRDTLTLANELKNYDVVIAGIYPSSAMFENYYVGMLNKLDKETRLVNVLFTHPSRVSLIENLSTIVAAYIDENAVQQIVAQSVFGALPASARLPLTISTQLPEGSGKSAPSIGRLAYSIPTAVGLDESTLRQVDMIAEEAIKEKATPGCQIIIARKGKIVYEKCFGWQTYDRNVPITPGTIYDLASVTKVAATLQGIMFLYDRGLIDVNKKVSHYLPELEKTNKKDITIKDVLTHQAGLWPFIPYWMQTKKDSVFMPQYFGRSKSDTYPYQVGPHLYGTKALRDSVWSWTIKSRLREKIPRTPYNYTYSDIGLYLMFGLNERLLNQYQNEFLLQNLYEPLGAGSIGYLPLSRFPQSRIAPTEVDNAFRKELVVGTVHDEGAALFGGVAGHAGLFGAASDLAKLGQMLLQEGHYGGIQYYKPETVRLFTARQFETSRRGLGWDKPVISQWNSPTSIFASPRTFGHTGFTGTCIWVDPQFDLVYIFLSNRVYPTREGNKLSGLNIRSRIQDTIYRSIFNYCQYENLATWTKSK